MSLLNWFYQPQEIIFETTSPVSGDIKVVKKGAERRLVVNRVCQSVNFEAPQIERRVWGRLANLAENCFRDSSGGVYGYYRCLMLGLGAGTICHLLTQTFPQILIDGVELDPAIVAAGQEYFDLDGLDNLTVYSADAFGFVTDPVSYGAANLLYDMIFVDLYCGGSFPEEFASIEFLSRVQTLLAPRGRIFFNRIFQQGHRAALDYFVNQIDQVFRFVEEFTNQGPYRFVNLLLVGSDD